MSPHNQNEKRIQKIRRELSKGVISEAEANRRISVIQKLPSRFVARWTQADGKERTKVCKSRTEAERLERDMQARVSIGDYTDPKVMKTRVSAIVDQYADKLRGRASYSSARAQIERIKSDPVASVTLAQLDAHPEKILGDYLGRLRKNLRTESTVWNNVLYFRAAVNDFIRRRRLRVVDPFQVVSLPKPDNRRLKAPTFEEYRAMLREAGKKEYPRWVSCLFVLAWEMGRRGGEYLSLRWENFHPAAGGDLPWVRILTEKQGKGREVWDDIPISDEAALALKSIQGENSQGPVFPLKRAAHDRYIRRVMDKAGFPSLWLHDFRRAWKNRNLHLPATVRQGLQGHGEEMDARYTTDKRKALEPAFRSTGDFRETNLKNEVSK